MTTPAHQPATWKQRGKLDSLFGDDPSSDQLQQVLANGDLFKLLIDASNLKGVDRKAFAALLAPSVSQPNYTAVSDYVDIIMARSKLRGWGFTKKHADAFSIELVACDHAGPLAPTGTSMWLGRDLAYNWAERVAWLKDVAAAEGLEYYQSFDSSPNFYPGSEVQGKLSLHAAGLDLSLWDLQNGLVPDNERPKQPRWPSLEVPDLLCLNPELLHLMDGKNFPYLMAPGLVVDSGHLPHFRRYGRRLYVRHRWAAFRWYFAAVVRFREF